jgi:hypothetical protein
MTGHISQLPNPDGSLFLRELNHRINNDLTVAVCGEGGALFLAQQTDQPSDTNNPGTAGELCCHGALPSGRERAGNNCA